MTMIPPVAGTSGDALPIAPTRSPADGGAFERLLQARHRDAVVTRGANERAADRRRIPERSPRPEPDHSLRLVRGALRAAAHRVPGRPKQPGPRDPMTTDATSRDDAPPAPGAAAPGATAPGERAASIEPGATAAATAVATPGAAPPGSALNTPEDGDAIGTPDALGTPDPLGVGTPGAAVATSAATIAGVAGADAVPDTIAARAPAQSDVAASTAGAPAVPAAASGSTGDRRADLTGESISGATASPSPSPTTAQVTASTTTAPGTRAGAAGAPGAAPSSSAPAATTPLGDTGPAATAAATVGGALLARQQAGDAGGGTAAGETPDDAAPAPPGRATKRTDEPAPPRTAAVAGAPVPGDPNAPTPQLTAAAPMARTSALARVLDAAAMADRPAQVLTRLAVELDDATRVAVRVNGHAVRVDVLEDANARLDAGWRRDVADGIRRHGLEYDRDGADANDEQRRRQAEPETTTARDGGARIRRRFIIDLDTATST